MLFRDPSPQTDAMAGVGQEAKRAKLGDPHDPHEHHGHTDPHDAAHTQGALEDGHIDNEEELLRQVGGRAEGFGGRTLAGRQQGGARCRSSGPAVAAPILFYP